MKKTIMTNNWREAEEILNKANKVWIENGEYQNGQRGACGELGWTRKYAEADGIVWNVEYDCGFPVLWRTVEE